MPALVGMVSGLIAPVILQLFQQRNQTTRTNAEAMKSIAEGGEKAVSAAVRLLDEYQDDNATLRKEVDALRAEIISMRIDERAKELRLNAKIEALEQYIKLLIDTLRNNNLDIPPRPDILKESDPKIKPIK